MTTLLAHPPRIKRTAAMSPGRQPHNRVAASFPEQVARVFRPRPASPPPACRAADRVDALERRLAEAERLIAVALVRGR